MDSSTRITSGSFSKHFGSQSGISSLRSQCVLAHQEFNRNSKYGPQNCSWESFFVVNPANFKLLQNPPDVLNNIIVHIYLNAKEKQSHTTATSGPIKGLFGIGTSHGGPGSHTNPIVITKDFDRDTLEFIEEDKASQLVDEGPANIVEVKAMVSTPDRKIENTLNKAVNSELDRAIPMVMNRLV
ncbi:hypothetical protein ANCDUO_08791 [Ancylostoma duodenale]|uniref:Uncharacterized protein n=1 Tax=Ancylostoma duodenale TaxID=51022 RepID=A0A0C2GID6_9BILA|nr:hypothetical protein ANCDUO_08791 [Ancylostoma duodenale]